jgi:small-conductance mechanosensitive channel
MQPIYELLELKVIGNTLADWGLATLAFLVTFTVLPLLKSYLLSLSKRRVQHARVGIIPLLLRLIPRTSRLFMWVVALNMGERFLDFSHRVDHVLQVLVLIGIWFQIGLWGITVVDYLLERKQRERGTADSGFANSIGIINFIARAVIWSVVCLLALDNLGVNITALVAGLGVGGIAIALAVQTILGDLLASLSIALDKPFAVGDNITLGDMSGKVEQIGVRSTRIRSVDGEQIIIANADLLKGRLRNFRHLEERRIVISLGLSYETPHDKVQLAVRTVEEAIRSQSSVRLEYCHFKEFGAFALQIEAIYFVVKPGVDTLLNVQQAINFKILLAFERAGIHLAYPTQTVFLKRGAVTQAPA